MARIRKPRKNRSGLEKIRCEKRHVARLIYTSMVGGACSQDKVDKFVARWQKLCDEEMRAMVKAAKTRKSAAV